MGELNNFFQVPSNRNGKKLNFSHLAAKKESSLENLFERKFKDLISATLHFFENILQYLIMAAKDLELFEDKLEVVQKKELFHFEVITLKSCDGGKRDKSR